MNSRLLSTIRYMRPGDIRWRLMSALKYRLYRLAPVESMTRRYARGFAAQPSALNVPTSQRPQPHRGAEILQNRFTFLNQSHTFPGGIEWNTSDVPKLWLYNLHYFDYLEDLIACGDQGIKKAEQIIDGWIDQNPIGWGNGWEPYTLALRIVNWMKFLSATNVAQGFCDERQTTNESLYTQANFLAANLEPSGYSNHTLKSRKALLFAGAFFGNDWFEQGLEGFCQEIEEQILDDGGHNERSPMYHLLALEDALDVARLLQACDKPIPEPIEQRLSGMLDFALSLQCPDGRIACFNDSAEGIAPHVQELLDCADRMGYHATKRDSFAQSGYYVIDHAATQSRMVIDCGPLGPRHNPGHAHCDALSYELSVKGQPFIVDSGTYEYQSGSWRDYFRSTRAHNTVSVDGQDQAELWGSFRASTRLSTQCKVFDKDQFIGCHDGFLRFPQYGLHQRTISLQRDGWSIHDHIDGEGRHTIENFIHLQPDAIAQCSGDAIQIDLDGISVNIVVPADADAKLIRGQSAPILGWYSPTFGVRQACFTIAIRIQTELPAETGYRLVLRQT